QVDALTNQYVLQNSAVGTTLMGVDEAIELGAQAQFGEKYGDEVRVVSMGQRDDGKPWSLELCGGTHVDQTGDIGLVTIVSEAAVASGVRRVEALTGDAARKHLQDQERLLRDAATVLKATPADVPVRVAALLEERKKLERELADAKKKLALGGGTGTGSTVETINGIQFSGRIVEGVSPRDLKGMVDEQKAQLGSGIVLLGARSEDGKAAIVVGVSNDLTDRMNAVDLVRLASEKVGGKGGGGRPDMAQAGGPNGKNLEAALEAVRGALS
ncbi:MAG: DHHA1 domain-containing protein, partial [Pseudomonadota bacterium]